jgi:predicted metal-dependent HD superfamily phosphohydrolase
VRDQCEYPLAVEMAIWFHDIAYDVQRKDNEAQSQRAALKFLHRAYAQQRPSQDFENIIALTTQHIYFTGHTRTAENQDTHIMVDIDLSILGRDWETYERYTKQIREEYKTVLKPLYVLGRKKIMKTFLSRPRIFLTPFFSERYELQARKNIERELKELKYF